LDLILIKGHYKMCSFVTQYNATDVSSFEGCAIGMLIAGMSTRAVAREFHVHFSTISHLQRCFIEFGSVSNRPHNRRPLVWRCVSERFADVNIVYRVLYGKGGVMVWAAMGNKPNCILSMAV
jgi:hypothetical protein